jgi:hypothetical protein
MPGRHPAGYFIHGTPHIKWYANAGTTRNSDYRYKTVPDAGKWSIQNKKVEHDGLTWINTEEVTYVPGTITNEPEGAFIHGILPWVAKEYGRSDALQYYRGIEFMDMYSPFSSIDHLEGTPDKFYAIPTSDAAWNTQTPFGWTGQAVVQIMEILEKYWPNQAWHDNPDAQLIFVCHSAGGLLLRNIIDFLSNRLNRTWILNSMGNDRFGRLIRYNYIEKASPIDAPYELDLRTNIAKVVTFASPHNGGKGAGANDWNNYFNGYSPFLYDDILAPLLDAFQPLPCGEQAPSTPPLRVLEDVAGEGIMVKRLRDKIPARADGSYIPFVCLSFAADKWASGAFLSQAISGAKNYSNYAEKYLLQFDIKSYKNLTQDVHGLAVRYFVDDKIFRQAMEFHVSPNDNPSNKSSLVQAVGTPEGGL